MNRFLERLKAWLEKYFSGPTEPGPTPTPTPGEWPKPGAKVRSIMVTPLLVMNNADDVRAIARQIKASRDFDSVLSLVDLQTGSGERSYIFPGRNATALDAKTIRNMEIILSEGITLDIHPRNDWSARTQRGIIPSVGRKVSNDGFYSDAILATELQFLSSMKRFYPYIRIFLNIEPSSQLAGPFAIKMAQHLRKEGFTGQMFVNPYLAEPSHDRRALESLGVQWAKSYNGEVPPVHPVWNTDGNLKINPGNAGTWIARLVGSGKSYVLWAKETANSERRLPNEYVPTIGSVPVIPPSSGSLDINNPGKYKAGYLWKPVSDRGQLVILLPAPFTGKTTKAGRLVNGSTLVESLSHSGVANGDREHYRGSKAGGSYPSGVAFEIEAEGHIWTWKNPGSGGTRYDGAITPTVRRK
jgi:hypothetical protein